MWTAAEQQVSLTRKQNRGQKQHPRGYAKENEMVYWKFNNDAPVRTGFFSRAIPSTRVPFSSVGKLNFCVFLRYEMRLRERKVQT